MHSRSRRNLWVVATSVLCVGAYSSQTAAQPAGGQAPSPSGGDAPSPQLQPYTAPDQSASAGVPPGWKVNKGEQTVISMTGPNGESIELGNTAVVRNGPFVLGQRPGSGIDLSMPDSASLSQKFTMVVQQNAAISNTPQPQLTIPSVTPLPMPAAFGQCGRLVGSINGQKGPMKFLALMCSLPVDRGGTYKVMFKLAMAPGNVAAQEAALASAVFASYRVPPAMLQRKVAPNTPAPAATPTQVPGGAGAMVHRELANSDCFDLVVIRETPTYLLPMHCGGRVPD